MASKRILIVGGVAGGASCAARLRRLDEQAEIFVFERSPDVSFANCGLPYHAGGVIQDRRKLLLATPEKFRDWFSVEVRTRHEVQEIDRERQTIEVQNLQTGRTTTEPYDVLVLAPGAAPVQPPLPGIDLPGIFSLRNLEDVDRINAWSTKHEAEQAVVVGGGYIGLEMVENFSHRGMNVTLLEQLDQIMPPMDPEMLAPAYETLRANSVDVRLSNGVVSFEPGEDHTLAVVCEDKQRLTADIVILAIGVRPEVRLAEAAGLAIGETGGIQVDERMRTSDPAIFAVGDAVEVQDFVTGRPSLIPLAGPANRQGRLAADAICGRESTFRGTQGTAVLGLFDLTLAMTGASEKTLREADMPYEKSYTHSFDHASYYPGAEMMMLKLLFAPDNGRILGAQAIGRQGVDKRIDVIAMAIQMGATVDDLKQSELCYAPQFGSAKDPVNMAGFVAENILADDVDVVHWVDLKNRRETDGEPPLVLDVRNPAETGAASVPGAMNLPLGELRTRLDELPRDREIWVHCGVGLRSYYASRILRQNGFKVRNLSGGMKTCKALP